jgi:hypothetical protein
MKMMKIEKMVMELVKEKVIECGERYKFDGEQAFREMMELKVKEKIVLPFSKETVCEDGCQGLKYNLGLFTQCEKKRKEGEYCGGCGEKGVPECGTVGERLAKGLEFRDPKGRSPVSYLKVMKKKGWSMEDVKREAENKGLKLDEHLEKKEKRGRPKKEKKEVESTGITDLFANIVAEEIEEKESSKEQAAVNEAKEEKEAQAAVKAAKAQAVEKQKADKEAKQKADKEAKAQAVEKQKADKEAKQKADKEAKAQAAAVKAEKEAKQKAEKEAKEALKKDKKEEKKEEVARPKITVSRIEIEGKKYLKSSENILYDPETKEEMGIWNEEKKIIMPLPEDEEYESD